MFNPGTFTTRSGHITRLRFIKKEDAGLLIEFFHYLSSESRRLRFHLYTAKIPEERVREEARTLSDLDPGRQAAIVATRFDDNDREYIIGVARFARTRCTDTEAEVAVVVRDDFQRRGLGKHLLLTLADYARTMGITHFSAWVMAENVRLMKLVKGLEIKGLESKTRCGEIKIRGPIT